MSSESGVARSLRDRGLTALVEGFFAAGWFGWTGGLRGTNGWLIAGSIVGYLMAAAGLIVFLRHRTAPSAATGPDVNRRYGVIVGIEFGSAIIGAVILGWTGLGHYAIILVSFIVGVHFFPLARVLADRMLIPLGALMTLGAVVGFAVAFVDGTTGQTIAGVASGVLLLVFAALSLLGLPVDRTAPDSTADTTPVTSLGSGG